MIKNLQFFAIFMTLLTCIPSYAQWEQLSNGGGGAFQDFHFDQNKAGRVWISSDVDGIYTADNYGNADFTFRGSSLKHAFSFTIETKKDFNKLFHGGIYGAHYTTYNSNNDPNEWIFIEQTRGIPSGTIAISNANVVGNNRVIVIAPSWNNKDPQIKAPKDNPAVYEPSGERKILISRDNGTTFNSYTYESQDGYRQVYSAEVGNDGTIYLGASAGIYVGNWNGSTYNFTRIPNPNSPNNIITVNDGVGITNKNGGCTGLTLSPDGTKVFASYHMEKEAVEVGGSLNNTFDVFVAKTSDLQNSGFTRGNWTNVSQGLRDNVEFPLAEFATWHAVNINTWTSTSTVYNVILGIANDAPNNGHRQGLWKGTITFDASGNLLNQQWNKIIDTNGNKVGTNGQSNNFNIEYGWEERALVVRGYEVAPNFPGFQQKFGLTGGQNLFVGTPTVSGFPYSSNSWKQIYTQKIGTNNGFDTYTNRGLTNSVAYDTKQIGNYMIQVGADHGVMQSVDNGLSWSSKAGPKINGNELTNSTGVGILTFPDRSPIVIVDGRFAFGAPQPNDGRVYAFSPNSNTISQLTTESDWSIIGGGAIGTQPEDNGNKGLPAGRLRSVVQGNTIPQRVYISIAGNNFSEASGRTDLKAGIYIADNITNLINSYNVNWRKITPDVDAYNFNDFQEIYVDPIDDDIIWAKGSGPTKIYKGVRNGDGSYTFEESNVSVGAGTSSNGNPATKILQPTDMDIFKGNDNKTWGIVTFSVQSGTDRESTRLLINKDMTANWNTAANWEDIGLNANQALTITSVPTDWLEANDELNFSTVSAQGNIIIAGLSVENKRRGLGMFKGKFNNDFSQITWTDWTGNMYQSRFDQADFSTDGNKVYILGGTRGVGTWRREVTELSPNNPNPTSNAIRYLRFTATGTVALEPRIKELKWFVGTAEYPQPKLTNQSNLTTSTVDNSNAYRVYDGLTNGGWSLGTTYPQTITIDLGQTIASNPDKLEISVNATNRNLSGFTCWSSTDGINFTKFFEVFGLETTDYTGTTTEFDLGGGSPEPEPSPNYRYLQFIPTGTIANEPRLKELKWFIGSNEFPNPKTTSSSNQVTTSTNQSDAFRIYDGMTNAGWLTSTTFPQTATIDLLQPLSAVPDRLEITVNAIASNFSGFECWGSIDGVNFEKFYDISGLTSADYNNQTTSFSLISNTSSRLGSTATNSISVLKKSNKRGDTFSFYPNPSNEMVYFTKDVSIAIYNALGVLIKKYESVNQIDVSNFQQGIYFMIDQNQQTHKLVVY